MSTLKDFTEAWIVVGGIFGGWGLILLAVVKLGLTLEGFGVACLGMFFMYLPFKLRETRWWDN